MAETYTQDELARAWAEIDSILGEEYRNNRLDQICVQARKNRLWEAQQGTEQVQSGNASIDSMREKLNLPPWGRPETSESIIFTNAGPVPFSEAVEKLKKDPSDEG